MAAKHNFIHFYKMRLILVRIRKKFLKSEVHSNGKDGDDYKVQASQNDFTRFGDGENKRGQSIASSQRMSCVMTTELLPLVYIYLHYICIKYG